MVDALSRVIGEHAATLQEISVLLLPDIEAIGQEVLQDPSLLKIIDQLKTDTDIPSRFTYSHNQLRYKGRLVIPRGSAFIKTILSDFHDSPVGGHADYLKTYKRVADQFYWIGMKGDIKRHVSECHFCQTNQTNSLTPAGHR